MGFDFRKGLLVFDCLPCEPDGLPSEGGISLGQRSRTLVFSTLSLDEIPQIFHKHLRWTD